MGRPEGDHLATRHDSLRSPEGNILSLHFLGFHALQALPVIAWLTERGVASDSEARRWVHVAGIAWLGAIGMVAWQTALGQGVTEPTPIVIAGGVMMLVWAAVVVKAALSTRHRSGAATTGAA